MHYIVYAMYYDTYAVKFATKCKKYTFWSAFFVSPTNHSCLISQSERNRVFLCLQDHMPYLDEGEGCSPAWAQMPLRLRQGQGLYSLLTTDFTYWPLYLVLKSGISLYLFLVVSTDHKCSIWIWHLNQPLLKTALWTLIAPHPGKLLLWLWRAFSLPS